MDQPEPTAVPDTTKMVKPWLDTAVPQPGKISTDQRDQPWQSLLADIQREAQQTPFGTEYFPCDKGFYAHSVAG